MANQAGYDVQFWEINKRFEFNNIEMLNANMMLLYYTSLGVIQIQKFLD